MNVHQVHESKIQRDLNCGNPDINSSINFKIENFDFNFSHQIHQDENVKVYRKGSEKKIYIDWRDLGYFLIEEGKEVTFQPEIENNFDFSFLKTVLFGPILSIILFQRDILVLHASAILDKNNKAIAFSGDSGSGKSTIATLMTMNGFSFVTDDVLPIKFDENLNPWVYPSLPLIKINPEVLDQISESEDVQVRPGSDGRISFIPSSFTKTPIKLNKIFFLKPGEETSLKKLNKQEFFMNLVNSTYCYNLLNDDELVLNLFQCSDLIKTVIGFSLELEFSLKKLKELSNII